MSTTPIALRPSDMLRSLAKSILSSRDPNLPGVSFLLARELSELERELERLKPLLRECARSLRKDSQRVSLPARSPLPEDKGEILGAVTVTFPREKISLVGDPLLLREALGESTFNALFESKVTYLPKEGILPLLKNLPPDLERLTRSSLRVSEDTPRVGFPSL